jgi:hypothetical protein
MTKTDSIRLIGEEAARPRESHGSIGCTTRVSRWASREIQKVNLVPDPSPWSHVVSIDGGPGSIRFSDRSGSRTERAASRGGDSRSKLPRNWDAVSGCSPGSTKQQHRVKPPHRCGRSRPRSETETGRDPLTLGDLPSRRSARGECRPPGMRPVPLPQSAPDREWPGPAGARPFRAGVRPRLRPRGSLHISGSSASNPRRTSSPQPRRTTHIARVRLLRIAIETRYPATLHQEAVLSDGQAACRGRLDGSLRRQGRPDHSACRSGE